MPYIPAILITLYDGYYIYSPSEYSYTSKNEAGEEEQKTGYTHILKPYVYYSAKYKSGNDYVIVNYSLDNYITIYGVINGEVISNAGYLESNEVLNNIKMDGESLSENVTYRISNGNGKYTFTTRMCPFLYVGGNKVYQIDDTWYYLNDLDLIPYKGTLSSQKDMSAVEYKNSAIDFQNWLHANSALRSIVVPKNAVNSNNEPYEVFAGNNNSILSTDPEDPASLFNQHKREIIKISIQDNLNNAIAIYNDNSGALGTNATFGMPKLNELDWEKILTNVNIVTFMQGLPVGNKLYNNYSIVTSTNNKQYINPNAIYFIDDSNTYHTLHHVSNNNITGYKSFDFKKVRYDFEDASGKSSYKYYYRRPEYACYECIVDSSHSQYDLSKITNDAVKRAYYTALARERYNLDKVTKPLINYNH